MDINSTLKSKNNRKATILEWQGINQQGIKVSGTIKNITTKKARTQLLERGIKKIKIKQKRSSIFNISFDSITNKDIASITRQLATMVKAGLAVIEAFKIIEKGIEKDVVKDLVILIREDLNQGIPLTEAFKKHPKYFDKLYCSLIEAGEKSGSLDILLDRIASFMEKNEDIKNKVKKAMYYPIAVISISLVVTAILLLKVVPQFQGVFDSFGAELPFFTQMIIKISDFLQENFFKLIIGIVLVVYLFKKALNRSKRLKFFYDKLILQLPLIGSVMQKSIISRFSRTLSTTFTAGVPLVKALDFTAGSSGNELYIKGILEVKDKIESGMQFNDALTQSGLFPVIAIQMVTAGETVGMLPEMLEKFATIYEDEVDDIVGGLSSLIEPLVISILGILVGGLIIAMYLPIFQLGSLV